ncbi:MAG: FAD binding domain-containing protein [Planctomycetaceae bacterium]|nr:FAD binding domain-containing protein [Planctomycetaceae bacterium]
MRPFEYASPETEAEAADLLADHDGNTAVLAGGTDLLTLLKRDLVTPQRVVDLKTVPSLVGVTPDIDGVRIGALTPLDELQQNPLLAGYQSLLDAIDGIRSVQIQSMGTVGGDLCHLPNCWYFRSGHGLLAMENGESLVETGENRYHAILGNHGPAKFVSASRFAPGLISLGARVRIAGPGADDAETIPLEYFYITPRTERQGVTILRPGQFITHILLPSAAGIQSATYDVLASEGLDWPLVSAAAGVQVEGGLVRDCRIVLGHAAPVPWIAHEAARLLTGRPLNEETAAAAGAAAVAAATPLSRNGYKVQMAAVAVKRALLKATGQLEGGL